MTTTEILLGTGVAVFSLYAVFSIISFISIRRTSDSIRRFLADTGTSLDSTLAELRTVLENANRISRDIREVAEDIKQVSHGIAEAEQVLRSRLASLDHGVTSAVENNVAGLKAGVAAGVRSLVHRAAAGKE